MTTLRAPFPWFGGYPCYATRRNVCSHRKIRVFIDFPVKKAMPNLKDCRLADGIPSGQFPEGCFDVRTDCTNLIVREFSTRTALSYVRRYSLCDMFRGLFRTPIFGRSCNRGDRDGLPFSCSGQLRYMFWRLLPSDNRGASLSNAFRTLLFADVCRRHLTPRFLGRTIARCAFTAIGKISEGEPACAKVRYPAPFGLSPIPRSCLHYFQDRTHAQVKQLPEPVIFVRPATPSVRTMCVQPLLRIPRPSNIADNACARISKRVDIPKGSGVFHNILYHFIALCGYEGEHTMPDTWTCLPWKSRGGYAHIGDSGVGIANRERERIWFSPFCLQPGARNHQKPLFSLEDPV